MLKTLHFNIKLINTSHAQYFASQQQDMYLRNNTLHLRMKTSHLNSSSRLRMLKSLHLEMMTASKDRDFTSQAQDFVSRDQDFKSHDQSNTTA